MLLTDATWWGTLAAARDLGSRGVSVTLASDAWLAPARGSRFVSRTVRCPPVRDVGAFLAWLLDFGRREPGHAYYPTSDEAAWIVAAARDELSAHFHLFSPPIEALACLLDKWRLAAEGARAGLDAPESWSPADERAAGHLAAQLSYPVVLKPRVTVLSDARSKGRWARSGSDFLAVWRWLRSSRSVHPLVAERLPEADAPLVQTRHDTAERVYTVDGFADKDGAVRGALACVKTLQRPRGSGPGIIFEDAPLDRAVAEGLGRLFRAVGFRGVFDAEFLPVGDRLLLIDLNPRFYNHMAFEVDRGLPLPWLAYLAAIEDREALEQALEAFGRVGEVGGRTYLHAVPVRLMLLFQALSGAMSREERARVRSFLLREPSARTDPARWRGDPWPGRLEMLAELRDLLRHPRAWVRTLAARGPGPGRTW